jgi:hypothetical protein
MANPKVAWAIQDPAPMTVVVRRADAAANTTKEIDRLLTSTPANADSDWVGQVGPSKDDAKSNMKTVGDLPVYKASKARVVPSEVWVRTLPGVKSDAGHFPSLLAAVDPSLADKYAKIMAKKQEIADLKAQAETEDQAASAKGVSDGDKKTHKDKEDGLNKQISTAEDAVGPLEKDFVKAAKDSAAKASADVKSKFGAAFVNLRQAADDADIANGAAAVRYPLAVPGIKDALVDQAKTIVADVIEDRTGHRPILEASFKPGVTFEGGTVGLTINGMSQADLGKLSIKDLTAETLKRTQAWVEHAVGLLADISKTKEILSFEEDVLDGVLAGFKSSGWTAPAAATIDGTAGGSASASASANVSVGGKSVPTKIPGT